MSLIRKKQTIIYTVRKSKHLLQVTFSITLGELLSLSATPVKILGDTYMTPFPQVYAYGQESNLWLILTLALD